MGPFIRRAGVGWSAKENRLQSAIIELILSSALSAHLPWHTHRELSKILASPSFQPPLYPRPSTSRQIRADFLFQTRPQSTQRWEPRDPTSGQISMIDTSTRRVPRRSLHLLSPTSSPKLYSTPRRG